MTCSLHRLDNQAAVIYSLAAAKVILANFYVLPVQFTETVFLRFYGKFMKFC